MNVVPSEIFPNLRRANRFAIDFSTIAESLDLGEFAVQIANISANGCMINSPIAFEKGKRLTLHLPVAGRIEAYMVWTHGDRTGFEFERVVRLPDFMAMIDAIKTKNAGK